MGIIQDIENGIKDVVVGNQAKAAPELIYPNQPNGLPAGPDTKPIAFTPPANLPSVSQGATQHAEQTAFSNAENLAVLKGGAYPYPSSLPPNTLPLALPSVLPNNAVAALAGRAVSTPGIHIPSYVAGLHDGAHTYMGMTNNPGAAPLDTQGQQGLPPGLQNY